MKKFLLFLLITTGLVANATTYYFSNSGSDANNGTSPATPWQTIAKFNAALASKTPGDNFLFNRGDVFYGNLIISRSGTAGAPITIGAYGTSADPVISGFSTVSSWANLGNNIWESSAAVSTLSTLNMVSINGVNTAMGRFPNTGSWSNYTKPTSSAITTTLNAAMTNWSGAEAVIRKNDFAMDRCSITGHSGTVLTFKSLGGGSAPTSNYGFFIQNDVRTLDAQNEWYYNPSTKKIRIFSTSAPANVKVATQTNVLSDAGFDYITIDGVDFTGSNSDALMFAGVSNNVIVRNCVVSFAGLNGINMNGNNDLIDKNTISNVACSGISKSGSGGSAITSNTISYAGVIAGQSFAMNLNRGIFVLENPGPLVQYNIIKNTGFHGIATSSNVSGIQIRNNFVDSAIMILNDGGGIYTGGASTGRIIDGNIVTNSKGATAGTPAGNLAEGIYLDELASNITVTNNTVANSGDAGIKLHKANTDIINNNTFYNNGRKQITYEDASDGVVHNNTMKSNIFFSRTSAQYCFADRSVNNDVSTFFSVSDSNYWARPMDDNMTFSTQQNNTGTVYKTLATWQPFTGKDVHSKKSPKAITDVNDLRIEYNATASSNTVSLDANYIDVTGKSYSGSITLAPYRSIVLIKNGAATNQAPKANAGANQSITLPTNTASLNGSATDADGSVLTYSWTKMSGPSAGTITDDNAATTSLTGLAEGVYQFQLKVTDNSAATSADTIQVTVTAAPNVAPTANAGTDQSITLPTNTASLNGNATDADGTIAAYAWTKISGPASGTISNATTASATVTGLTQGVYQFQLKATDNSAATSADTIQVTVTAAPNVAPATNAGTDQSITLPTNTASLNGNATDADGTIAAYAWTKISGPASGTISNATTASATVTGLTQGVYQFQLKATDNSAATSADTIQVTVTAPSNIAPTANAGADQAITLPSNSASLTGNGKDADGTITAYAWTKISGPAAGTITKATSVWTSVTGLVQGTYQFQLKVTDNKAATSTDTIQVLVNATSDLMPAVNPANTVNGLNYKYYEAASYSAVPSFSSLIPVKTGTTTNFDISVANRATAFAINFTGFITVPSDGQYTFYTTSDDGSKLYIDNILVVNNDSIHPSLEKSGIVGLKAGKHAISVGYFQQTGGKILSVSYSATGISKMAVPASALYRIATRTRNSVAVDYQGNDQTILSATQVEVKAYPNPFMDHIEINIAGGVAGQYKLMLIDASGKTIWTAGGMKNAGAFQQSVNTSNLLSGIYFLRVTQNTTTSVIKLVK